jgi:hypothetical protein
MVAGQMAVRVGPAVRFLVSRFLVARRTVLVGMAGARPRVASVDLPARRTADRPSAGLVGRCQMAPATAGLATRPLTAGSPVAARTVALPDLLGRRPMAVADRMMASADPVGRCLMARGMVGLVVRCLEGKTTV